MSKQRFNLNRAQVVDGNFVDFVRGLVARGVVRGGGDVVDDATGLTAGDLRELFESQVVVRHQDIEARLMRARDEGFYTIGSAGHEGNAVVGRVTRHTDIAFVHYRSGGFMAERSRKVPAIDFVRDTMLSFAASTEDPISGGRHKVWGSKPLFVPPQTSTIASHLPKAVGAAMAIPRAVRLGVDTGMPRDAIVVCSFGDASANHATAQTAFNAASNAAYRHLPVPLLFVCEDNGIGISVKTPSTWIEASMRNRPGLEYFQGDGLDLIDAYRATKLAVETCRAERVPVFLHLRTVRLLGHAGSDAETEYHSWAEIEANEARDPLLASAKLVVDLGVMKPAEVLEMYEGVRSRVADASRYAATTRKIDSIAEVVSALAPDSPDDVLKEVGRIVSREKRVEVFGDEEHLPENGPARHMAALINQGLHDLLLKYPEATLFGEDVAKKGGVYHVTTGLVKKFGLARVYNTILDETTILGLAIGAGQVGFLPIPEIQYLAYYHNAQDQIRGEACSLQFFSNDQFRNGMVMRVAGWAYQKGFGGHFHNDNSIAALRDVPGLVVACPSRGDDAVKMMRTCMAMARVDGRVSAFIEPIALYMTKDLYEPKDQAWSFGYPAPGESIALGEGAVYHDDAGDVTILTFANGVCMSLRAAKELREAHGICARVVDLRWLCPLNEVFIAEQAVASGRAVIVDEGRRTGGVGEAILAVLQERCGGNVSVRRVVGVDSYIPLGGAANLVLPQDRDVVVACREIMGGAKPSGNKKRPTRTASRG